MEQIIDVAQMRIPSVAAPNALSFASGTGTTDSSQNLTVTGLSFTPRVIIISGSSSQFQGSGDTLYCSDISTTYQYYHSGTNDYWVALSTNGGYVNSNGFKLFTAMTSSTAYWKAYG